MHTDYDNLFENRRGQANDLSAEQMLEVIFRYVGRIAMEKELNQLLILLADMGREIIVADRCAVWLVDDETQELWTKVAHGVDALRIPAARGCVGHTVTSGEPLIINDAYADARFDESVDKETGYHTHNIITLPIHNSEGKVFAAYQAVNKMTAAGKFTEADIKHLQLAATYTGHALEAAMLHHEIEHTHKRIIYTLAEAGETRSKETGNHVKRVAEYSRIFALAYGLDPQEAELLKIASPMHDIGKLGIPDAILLKPGRLDVEEFEVMKTHAALGHDMFRHSKRPILRAAAIIAHQHHEKWDGSGYPQGLSGEEIHIYGRITAIADVFDALGSERVYKKAWELDRIVNLFKDERGKHFDPRLVDIFLDQLPKLLKIRDELRDMLPDEAGKSAHS